MLFNILEDKTESFRHAINAVFFYSHEYSHKYKVQVRFSIPNKIQDFFSGKFCFAATNSQNSILCL